MSTKWESGFGHFSAFFELWTVFWAVFRYPSGKLKKKVAPGNSLNFQKKIKILTLIFGSQNCVFSKMYIFGAPIESEGLDNELQDPTVPIIMSCKIQPSLLC